MKYTRIKNFNYMTVNTANFMSPNWDKVATVGSAAGIGALGAGLGGAFYNQHLINTNRTPQETKKYMRLADKYNEGFDAWQNSDNPNKGFIANRDTPEGKQFIDTGEAFINEDQRLRDKYSSKGVTYGSLAGGALLGGGLAYALTRGR